jgi:hypothetical protein
VIKFNVNNRVKIKLTDTGKEILAKYWGYRVPNWYDSHTDTDGYTMFQLHEVMHIFGPYVYNGCTIPFETTILISTHEDER